MTILTVKTSKDFNINSIFAYTQAQTTTKTALAYVVKNLATGETQQWSGTNFTYDVNGNIKGGIASKLSIYDALGNLSVAAQFSAPWDFAKQGYPDTYNKLLSGNDTVTGGTGNDILSSGSSLNTNGIYIYNGHSYFLSNISTWTDAQLYAQSLGGNLVTINDQAEQNWLASVFLAATQGLTLWLGYTDQAVEGQWKWISGETSTYTNWAYGEPNNNFVNGGATEDYAHFWGAGFNYNDGGIIKRAYGTWNDSPNQGFTLGMQVRGIIEINTINNDIAKGGRGNDTYVVDNLGDKVVENTDEGTDTVNSYISYTLAANVEKLTLMGTQAINGTGNNLNNVITGNANSNMLSGLAGLDTLIGGAGNDSYIVSDTGDTVIENTSAGTDTVNSSVTYALSANVENLILTGTKAINGTGNDLNNVITGNAAPNLLTGLGGVDKLIGGFGNDIYIVDNAGDSVVETNTVDIDLVNSSVTYTLSTGVENLTLIGTAATNGIGNELNNLITGNPADNILEGFSGNDTLFGGFGNDTLIGGDGTDTIVYNGKSSDYKLTLQDGNLKIIDVNLADGYDGTDILLGIENIRFKDKAIVLDRSTPVKIAQPTNPYLDALTWGSKWNSNIITYAFDHHEGETLAWKNEIQLAFTDALKLFEHIIPLTFVPVSDPAQATFKFNLVTWDWMQKQKPDSNAIAYMNFPNSSDASTGFQNESGVMNLVDPVTLPSGNTLDASFTVGGFMFETIFHELGHGLGLAHPHDTAGESGVFPGVDQVVSIEYNDDGSQDTLYNSNDYGDYDLNQNIYTAMSYNYGLKDVSSGTSYGQIATPMALDIATLQAIYGANMAYPDGDGTVGVDDIYYLPDENVASKAWFKCIWDTGGIDIIEYNGSSNATIDLREATINNTEKWTWQQIIDSKDGTGGYISRAKGIAGGFTIANGVKIENAQGGSGDDIINGNSLNNVLNGGSGSDTMSGFAGNDFYVVDTAKDWLHTGDTVIEGLNQGYDSVQAYVNWTLGDNIENLMLDGSAVTGMGNKLSNTILGNSQDNILTGGGGSDTLTGNAGSDTFVYTSGSESPVGALCDTITDFVEGIDFIDLSGIDANTAIKDNNAFLTLDIGISDVIFKLTNALYFNSATHILYGNNDTDDAADFSILLAGVTNLEKTDIIL